MTRRAMTAREMISAEYGSSRNLMTPHRVRVGKIAPHIAFELSSGRGFRDGSMLYGVSIVVERNGKTERDTDASDVFSSAAEAGRYIAELRRRADSGEW